MYDLPYHKEQHEQTIHRFIGQHPFAVLMGCDAEQRPAATQVPLLLEVRDGTMVLSGHIMRNTGHHKAFLVNPNVLALFTGRHTYVSGTWYSNPNMPSTWNYMSVHAHGTIRFLEGDALEEMLRKTSLHFEGNDRNSTALYDRLPPEFTRRVLNAIVAFEIEVHSLDNVFKLSQDRDLRSYRSIIGKLRTQGEDGRVIAEQMELRLTALFPDAV